MSPSPLKFSLGISVLVHGIVIGGAVLLGKFERAPAGVVVGDATTLELIAAPASAPEAATPMPVAPVAPTLPEPIAALPRALPPEEIILQPAPEPAKIEDAIVPLPAPLPPNAEPQLVAQAVIPVPAMVATPEPTPVRGDNSSPTPGSDFTTEVGRPAVQAKPDYRKNPEPEYPLPSRRRGQEGLVLLNVTVSSEGRAAEVSLKQTSGYDLLDQAALKAVRTWQFEPARIGAIGVESKIEVPVRFKLNR